MPSGAKRKPKIGRKPLDEFITMDELADHLETRDQVVFVLAWVERKSGRIGIRIDESAWSAMLLELIAKLKEQAEQLRLSEGRYGKKKSK